MLPGKRWIISFARPDGPAPEVLLVMPRTPVTLGNHCQVGTKHQHKGREVSSETAADAKLLSPDEFPEEWHSGYLQSTGKPLISTSQAA